MHQALVVADDLTGANDTGNRFAARGFRTEVATGSADSDAPVLVVDTDSRYAPPADAADRVASTVEAHPATVVYKKVDSTLRGNLAAEVDAAVDAADADLAVVAPAFPANGRTTAGGFHLVDGTPVAETQAGADPDRPVTSSHVPTLFAESVHPVVHLPLDLVGDGPDAVADALHDAKDAHGTAVAVADATRPGHLAAVADGAASLDGEAVFVGSAGLAGHVHLAGEAGGVLGVVGSVSDATMAQLDAVDDDCVVTLDGPGAMTDLDAAVREAVEGATETLASADRAVVTAARRPADVEATLAAAADAGVSDREARDRVARALGRVASEVHGRAPVGGFFLTGGAVAKRALSALDGRGVRLTGRSVTTGVPLSTVVGGPAADTPVVTKAGAFGDDETIVNCLDFLARHDG
ncbi:MAG: four-carbon acid sugar kinase family protein [Halobacteriaceae archaeon]